MPFHPFKRVSILFFLFSLGLTPFLLPAQAQPPEGPPTPVVAAPVEERTLAPAVELVGTARPDRTSRVAAEVVGLVKEVKFNEGDLVKAGAVLVGLDQTNLQLSLKAARAALAGVKIQIEEARKDLERAASLRATDSISVHNYEKDLYRVKNLEQAVVGAEAETAQLEDTIRRMTVKAPFTGYVIEKHTELGQWLSPGAPVATIIDLSTVKVRVPLPERYVLEIKPGAEASVVFDALGADSFKGRVTTVIPSADEKARTLPVEVSLPNPEGNIKAGLLARVALTGPERKVLLISKDALVLDRGRATVFVVKGDEVFPVEVQTGAAYGQQVEISGQIEPGQMVVVQGNERLRSGQKVSLAQGQASPSTAAPGSSSAK